MNTLIALGLLFIACMAGTTLALCILAIGSMDDEE